MLTGRWVLFFGFIWLTMNLVVSNYHPTGSGSDSAKLAGYAAITSQSEILGSVGDVEEAIKLRSPMTQTQAIEEGGELYERAKAVLSNVVAWTTFEYGFTSPVWDYVQGIWLAFTILLIIQIGYTAWQFLPFV